MPDFPDLALEKDWENKQIHFFHENQLNFTICDCFQLKCMNFHDFLNLPATAGKSGTHPANLCASIVLIAYWVNTQDRRLVPAPRGSPLCTLYTKASGPTHVFRRPHWDFLWKWSRFFLDAHFLQLERLCKRSIAFRPDCKAVFCMVENDCGIRSLERSTSDLRFIRGDVDQACV